MLRKKDLAKQFELVVKQEIQNHNASILANNQRLNTIEESILETQKTLKEQIAAIKSAMVNEAVYKERKEDISKSYKQKLENEVYNLRDLFLEFGDDLKKQIKTISENTIESLSVEELKQIFNRYDKKFLESEEIVKQLTASYDKREQQRQDKVVKWKDSILEVINEYVDQIKTVIQKVSELQVDITGFKKMLKSSDRNIYLSEKKIENLYTLIERLNKRLDNESSRTN